MNIVRRLALAIALLVLTSCSPIVSVTEYKVAGTTDFSQLKTWQWDHNVMGDQHLTADKFAAYESIFKEEISKLAEAAHYQPVSEHPDFRLDYRATVTEEMVNIDRDTGSPNQQEVNDYGPKWTFGGNDGPTFKGFSETQAPPQFYEQCTVEIAAFDNNNQMIWHVSASFIVNPRATSEERDAVIRKTAQVLMDHFPKH